MVLETWVAPLIVLGFNLDLDNALDLSTLSAFAATEPIDLFTQIEVPSRVFDG